MCCILDYCKATSTCFLYQKTTFIGLARRAIAIFDYEGSNTEFIEEQSSASNNE